MDGDTDSRGWAIARRIVSVLCIVVGSVIVLGALVVGDCSAFGGRCPAEPPPFWDDDTVRIAALGATLAVGPPVFLASPSLRRFWIALAWAVGAAVVVGLIARSVTSG